MTAPSEGSAFGMSRKKWAGIPGVGADPLAAVGTRASDYIMSFEELMDLPPAQAQGPSQLEQVGPPAPAEEPRQEPPYTPTTFAPPIEERGAYIMPFEELMQGSDVLDPRWIGNPFERQKIQLRALGYPDENIRMFDSYLSQLLSMPTRERLRTFNSDVEKWEEWGLKPDEMDGIRKHLGILGMKDKLSAAELYAQGLMAEAEAQIAVGRVVRKGVGIAYQAAAKPYRKYITPKLQRTTEWHRERLKDAAGLAVRSMQTVVPGMEYYRDLVRSDNIKGIDTAAKWGLFPNVDELGLNFMAEQRARIAEEYKDDPAKRDAIREKLRFATMNPSASWLRKGDVPKFIDQNVWQGFLQTHPKTTWPILALMHPIEELASYATNAEKYPEVLVMLLGTKFVINPATNKFIKYAMTKKWGQLGLKDAYRYYRLKWKITRGGRPVPINKTTFMDFVKNVRNPDIAQHVKFNNIRGDADVALQYYQQKLAGLPEDQIAFLELLLRKTDGNLSVMVPRDPSALNFMFGKAAIVPTAGIPPSLLTLPPPGGTQAAAAQMAAQFAGPAGVALADTAAASVTDAQIAAAAVGVNRLAVKTRYSPEDIVFMRTMGMTDDQIVERAAEEHFLDADVSLYPRTGDRVIIPSMAYQEGTLKNIEDPMRMEVVFDNGMRTTLPQEQIFHAEQLKPQRGMPVTSFEEHTELKTKLTNGEPVTDAELETAPGVLKEMGYDELANQVLAKRKARDVRLAKETYRRSQSITPSNALEEAEVALEAVTEQARNLAQRLQEAAIPVEVAPAEIGAVEEPPLVSVTRPEEIAPPRVPPTAPEWQLPDGTPISQVPLEEYFLQGVPEDLRAIEALPAHRFGFEGVPTRQADQYVKAIGRMVKEYLPEKIKDFTRLKEKYYNQPGSVLAHQFDEFVGLRHSDYAKATFRREMEVTGESRPLQAALITHQNAVRQAVAEGVDLPDEVLADYPDIKKAMIEKSQLTSTPTAALNKELLTRAYPLADIQVLSETDKEWLISNNIIPDEISILENGQVVNIPESERPIHHPKAYQDITHADIEREFNKEKGIADMIADAWDDEEGFMTIPGGDTIKKLVVLASRVNKRLTNLGAGYGDDVTRSLESAIDKWAAEMKLAEVYGDFAITRNNKLVREAPTLKQRLFKGKKVKTFVSSSELELVVRYMDEPEFYANDYEALSKSGKALIKVLQDDYREMWKIANEHGILKEWVSNYTFRMYHNSADHVAKVQYGAGARTLYAQPGFAKQRKYATLRDAEAAGLNPIFDPVFLNGVYKVSLARTIGKRNLVRALMELNTDQGLPAIMARPPKGSPAFRVWQRDYVYMQGIKGLEQYIYIPKADKPGILVKVEAKADPKVAKRLLQIFEPFKPLSRPYKAFMDLKHLVMRGKMMNIVIHGANIYSDKLDEFNFKVGKILKYQKKAKQMWEEQDARVLKMVGSGLNLTSSHEIARSMRGYMLESHRIYEQLLQPLPHWLKKVGTGVGTLARKADELLWDYVRHSEISMCDLLTERLMQEHPEWPEGKAMRVAAHYTNTNLGRIPRHWMKPMFRKATGMLLFAPSWTLSNASMMMLAYPFAPGRYGLGLKGLDKDAREQIGRNFGKHIVKGVAALVIMSSVFTMMNIYIQNKMKEAGLIKGAPMKVRPPWLFASKRHWFDMYLYKDKRGQDVWLVPHLFRYIRDYIGFSTDPIQTGMNKMDVFTRMAVERLMNYQTWRETKVIPEGASGWNAVKEGITWFAESILPANYYAKRPGRKPTWVEWVAPFSGTWIRRSIPGGKMAKFVRDWMDYERYMNDKIGNKINEALDGQDFGEAMTLAMQRYDTPQSAAQAIANRMQRRAAPLNYVMRQLSEQDKLKFFTWLEEQGRGVFKNTYTPTDIADQMAWELVNLIRQRDAEVLLEEPLPEDEEDLTPWMPATMPAPEKGEQRIRIEQLPQGGRHVMDFEELMAPLQEQAK